jgi:hypothetical protein
VPRPLNAPETGQAGTPRSGGAGDHVALAVALLALLVLSPVSFLVAVGTVFGVIRQVRWHWWIPALAGLGVTAFVVLVVQVVTGNVAAFHFSGELALLGGEHPDWQAVLGPTLPVGIPAGFTAGACFVGLQEWWSGRAEWHPLEQRRMTVDNERTERRISSLLQDPTIERQCTSVPLGVARGGDLVAFQQGPFVVLPPRHNLAMGVVGASGSGKTVTLERLVTIWARAGKKVVFADFKGSDPELAARVVAAYKAVRPDVACGLWPAQPMDMWRGSPTEVANRLLCVQDFTEPYYKSVAQTAVRLAVTAPDIEGRGPITCAEDFMERLDAGYLRRVWDGIPAKVRDVESVVRKPEALDGVRLRYAGFFEALAGRFDHGFSYEDADLIVLTVPTLAEREDAMAAARMLLTDYGHYCLRRKPRLGEDTVFVLDEFSAVTQAAPMAIDLAERVRDVGGQVVVSAQGFQGLGSTEDERIRMREALAGGLIVHRCQDPEELLKVAGTVRATEQSWQLHNTGSSGVGSIKMHHKMRVDPDAVRQARVGEAWLISYGRALHMSVLQSRISAGDREHAEHLVRHAWSQASSDLWEGRTAQIQPWWELQLPNRQIHVGPTFLELEAGQEVPPTLPPPAVPPPSDPTRRLLLAIMAAIREGNLKLAAELVDIHQEMVPSWDGARFLAHYIAERDKIIGRITGEGPHRPTGSGPAAS